MKNLIRYEREQILRGRGFLVNWLSKVLAKIQFYKGDGPKRRFRSLTKVWPEKSLSGTFSTSVISGVTIYDCLFSLSLRSSWLFDEWDMIEIWTSPRVFLRLRFLLTRFQLGLWSFSVRRQGFLLCHFYVESKFRFPAQPSLAGPLIFTGRRWHSYFTDWKLREAQTFGRNQCRFQLD